ncbi:MAG: archaemetzincin family Zn-dependent metalloprotease [Bacteroidota bacterium]
MLLPIRIIPLHPVSAELIGSLIHPLRSIFRTDVSVWPQLDTVVDSVLDESRGQYNSTEIIVELLRCYPGVHSKLVGITAVDLFVPVLTYVFGEAQLDGPACVVSTYRLDDTIYGLEPDPSSFFERSLKETVHELGHTYGLLHCRNFNCAMHASTTAEDIDLKAAGLCEDCQKKIGL